MKQKNVETYEATAYVKCKARQLLSTWYPDSVMQVPHNELMKIRLEVDTNPPGAFGCEFKALLLPSPCKIRLYDVPSLFAGKIHALLCRKWTRVKGRDIYDYIFYLSKGAGVNMRHLKEKLASSKFIESGCDIDLPWLIEALEKRFKEAGLRAYADLSGDRMNAKIRKAQQLKVPYQVIIGEKEMAADQVSIRYRTGRQANGVATEAFIAEVKDIVDRKAQLD